MTATSKARPTSTKSRSDAVIGYVRVSTDGQADSGAGLAAQRATIEAECGHRGFTLAAIYEDAGASAKSLAGRPALSEALDALARGEASVLIVGKLDRLARSVADFASLVRLAERQGWAILACDLGIDMTSPTGGLLANVTASVAEWERRIIGVRTKEALAARRAAGVTLGRPRTLDPSIAAHIRSARGRFDPAGNRRWSQCGWSDHSHWKVLVGGSRSEGNTSRAASCRSMSTRRSFGNVRKLPSKRFQASYWHDGVRHVASSTFTTATDAKDWLTTEKSKVLRGSWIDPSAGNVTVNELSTQWLTANPGKRESTLARDEIALRRHIRPILGDRRIVSITPVDVQNLVSRWSDSQAPGTTRRNYDVLRAVFSYAVQSDFLVRSPCRNVHLPEVVAQTRDLLTPDDVSRIGEAMPEAYRLTVWFGAVLGLRWGEVAGLHVRRLDVFGKSVSIAEQVSRGRGGRPLMSPPKSKAGVRTLSMPDPLARMVAAHMGRAGLTAAFPDALLFTNDSGGPLDYTNFRRRIWIPAVTQAGLKDIGFHDLRRAAATALISEGVDIKTTQTRLGHSDPRLTLAIYAQATTEADQAAAALLGHKFFQADRRKTSHSSHLGNTFK